MSYLPESARKMSRMMGRKIIRAIKAAASPINKKTNKNTFIGFI